MNPILTEETALSAPTFFQLQEEDRYRLARALSNGPGQILANTLMELAHALTRVEVDPETARKGLAALREEVRAGLADLKAYVAELQPPLLDELGLGPSLQQYLTNFGNRNKIAVECVGCDSLRERLPSTIEIVIFRIVQEALANVVEHSGATRVRVQIERISKQVQVQIEDNGRGFSNPTGSLRHRQLGLVAMQDRAQLIGGQLKLFSEAGKGMRVVVTVPYHGQPKVATGGQDDNGRENQGAQNTGARKKAGANQEETGK